MRSELCAFSADGYCDDGGAGSFFSDCALGTDCSDCGLRGGSGGAEEEEAEEEAEEEEAEGAGPELPQVGTLAEAEAAVRRDPTGFHLPTIVPKSFQAAQDHARQHLELLRAGKLDSFDEMD